MKKFFAFISTALFKIGFGGWVVFGGTNSWAQTAVIQFNQLGFLPQANKLAVVTGTTTASKFYITALPLNDTVLAGNLSAQRSSKNSSTVTKLADFSALKKEGNFQILIPGIKNQVPFKIRKNVYSGVAKAVIKAFYYQRTDVPLEPVYAGTWSRPAGHPDTAVLVHPSAATIYTPAGVKLSSPKGWYDAGDYNKYIVNSGITMGTLFSAYEDFPFYFDTLQLNIPESGNSIPDILDEALYNLRWMLTMQDPKDGGVYHKLTNAAFDGMVMPGVTKEARYVVQKSTASALDFAAVMAQAARVLQPFKRALPGLADSCLKAAIQSWNWAQKNKELFYNQNEINQKFDPDISTGEYGDRSFKDEWLWAAAELYATTKAAPYKIVLQERMQDKVELPSWGNVALMGYYTLIRKEKQLPEIAAVVKRMKDSVLKLANAYVASQPANAFATVMGQSVRDFVWGSNAVAANQGILLINAYFISKNKKYLEGAWSNVDYLLGRNATGYSFITGYGVKTPLHPHHRPSEADGIVEPVPGFLVGGPNPGMQDKCDYVFKEPETAYVDHMCSYASNEIAINWNAPTAYLLNAICAMGKK